VRRWNNVRKLIWYNGITFHTTIVFYTRVCCRLYMCCIDAALTLYTCRSGWHGSRKLQSGGCVELADGRLSSEWWQVSRCWPSHACFSPSLDTLVVNQKVNDYSVHDWDWLMLSLIWRVTLSFHWRLHYCSSSTGSICCGFVECNLLYNKSTSGDSNLHFG